MLRFLGIVECLNSRQCHVKEARRSAILAVLMDPPEYVAAKVLPDSGDHA